MENANNFGSFVRDLRLSLGLTLKDFCIKHKLNCVILSKIERGVQVPKRTELRRLGEALKLLDDSVEQREFFKLFEGFSPKDLLPSSPLFLPEETAEEDIVRLFEKASLSNTPSEKEAYTHV